MKIKLTDTSTIWYMMDNKVCSAPILATMQVENLHNDWDSTPAQAETFIPFGKAGNYYATCHGVFNEDAVFATKDELLASL